MVKTFVMVFLTLLLTVPASGIDGTKLLKEIDRNLNPESYEMYRKLINVEPNGRKMEYTFFSVKKGLDKLAGVFLAPASEKGRSTLRLGENMWLYIPNVGKPIRITSLQSVIGGVFNNADILSLDYAAEYNVEKIEEPGNEYLLYLKAKTKTVAYDRIKLWADKNRKLPTKIECLTEASMLIKTLYFKFDLSEIEKKPYHLGGYLELRPVLFGLDRDASLYKLKFFKRDEGKTIEEYNGKLQLEGSFEKGIARLFVKTNFDLKYSYLGLEHNDPQRMIYEGYLSLKPSPSLTFKLGKQTLLWGKGYAWNPVAFVSKPKDPDDPELALEGYITASADYIKSFQGPLKTASITPVIFPVYKDINDDFGTINRLNFAGKLYLLLYDMDIDFIAMTGGSRTSRVGMDFSKNITTNLEIHGEFAFINNQKSRIIDSQGNISEAKFDAKSYLLGIRYLTASETTFIFEYYRNGIGLTHLEMKDFFSFIDKGYDLFLSKGNDSLLKKAAGVTQGNYGRSNPMEDYLYLRISQKEPFNILYFTPAITTIMNLNDQSLSLSPELLYTGIKNLEIRLKAIGLLGGRGTEFGEKQNDYRVELRVRYYF